MYESTKKLVTLLGDAGFHRWEYKANASKAIDTSAYADFIGTEAIAKAASRIEDLQARGLRVYPVIVQGQITQISVSLPRSVKHES